MTQLTARFTYLAIVAAFAGTLVVSAYDEAEQSQAVDRAPTGSAAEVFRLVNARRSDEKLPALKWNPALARAAREQAERCAASGKLSRECHEYGGALGERLKAASFPFRAAGENLASYPTPAATVEAWMKSPAHHDNMLNPDVDQAGFALATHEGFTITCAIFAGAAEASAASANDVALPASSVAIRVQPASQLEATTR